MGIGTLDGMPGRTVPLGWVGSAGMGSVTPLSEDVVVVGIGGMLDGCVGVEVVPSEAMGA